MNRHQVLTGAANNLDNTVSIGSVENNHFTVGYRRPFCSRIVLFAPDMQLFLGSFSCHHHHHHHHQGIRLRLQHCHIVVAVRARSGHFGQEVLQLDRAMHRVHTRHRQGTLPHFSFSLCFYNHNQVNASSCLLRQISAGFGNMVYIFEPTPSVKKSTHVSCMSHVLVVSI